jgi:protein O-mannosyl-transferase
LGSSSIQESKHHKISLVENSQSSEVSTKVPTTSVCTQEPPSWFHRDWLLGLILILLVILAYTPVWRAGFVWDDATILTANPCIVGPLGLKEIWASSAADICPLTVTTFWVEHALWGLNPLPYHLVNVLLHGLNAVVLWRVLLRLHVGGAWLGAALWAAHPVGVESVAWITEMKNTESGLLFLLSILFFLTWLEANYIRKPAGLSYALSLLFAGLAMASKSSTVILPVILCLCAWWLEERWSWRKLARTIPIFLMACAGSALSIWTQGLQLARDSGPQWVRTWPERLAAAGDGVWFYLGKLLWPHPIITIYSRWKIDAGQWVSFLPLLVVIVVLFVFWMNRERWSRACFFAFAYFIAALIPVVGLIDAYIFRYSLVFDHFQDLASIGPLALAGTGLVRFANFIVPKNPSLRSALCAVPLLILALASWHRTWAYEDDYALWTDALAKNPNCWMCHFALASALVERGQVDEGVAQYRKVMEIIPNYWPAHLNLGVVFLQFGQLGNALTEFQKAVEIDPVIAQVHDNLGTALFRSGRLEDAIDQFRKALGMNSKIPVTHYNLGVALVEKGDLDEALTQFQDALRLKPDLGPAKDALNQVQVSLRKREDHR